MNDELKLNNKDFSPFFLRKLTEGYPKFTIIQELRTF